MADKNFNNTDLIINREFFSDFDDILTCSLCLGFLIKPLQCISCQNNFCNDCLQTWDKKKDGNPKCPIKCKDSIFLNNCKSVIKILEKLIIKCHKCLVEVNYQDLVNHLNITCVKNKIQCDNANQGCLDLITRDEMQKHILSCEYGIIQCEECGNSTLKKNTNKIIEQLRQINDEIFKQNTNIKLFNETI